MTTIRRPSKFVTPMALLVGLIVAACAGAPGTSIAPSEAAPSVAGPSASAEPASDAPTTEPTTVTSPSPAAVQELKVQAEDFKFGLPATATAGATSIVLTNAGQEAHQAQIARINDGTSFEDLTAALQNPDPSGALALISLVGGPTGVQPGATGTVGLTLQPGPHVFLCFLPSPDGVPHLAKGMIAQLEVTEPVNEAALPSGDASLTLQDFSFTGLDTLTAGPHTLAVTNAGPQPHEAGLVKLAAGMTVPGLLAMLSSGEEPTGPPPWTDVGGIAGIAPGSNATMDVDLAAGEYAFVCFIPDPATGKAHLELGMIGALSVN